MINVRVLEAKNLPIFNSHLRKTIISCFSYSSYRYFYGTYKSNEKTINPKWNLEFNVDMFRLIQLRFYLYGFRSMKQDFYIGNVTINFNQFILNPPGDQILRIPGSNIQTEFPIKSPLASDSQLTIVFTYIPKIYRSIKLKSLSYMNSSLHIYTTYSPSLDYNENPVEIELLQAFLVPNEKEDPKIGYFYNLNKKISWESVGRSSLSRCINGPTGPTQVHSLSLAKISGKYTFFILNVSDFSGKISLNFVYEKSGEISQFADRIFFKTKKSNQSIGLIKTIDVDVDPNKKYLIPYYFHIETNSMLPAKYEFKNFLDENEAITYDKTFKNYSSEIEFHTQIIDKAHSISALEKVDFLRTNILPIKEKVSLADLLNSYNLKNESDLRFYVGGSTTNTAGLSAYVDYWEQNVIGYYKTNGQICSQISNMIEEQLEKQQNEIEPISYLSEKVKWNSILSLNLSKIDKDVVLVYYVHCNSYLMNAFPNGFFLISYLEDSNETILYRNNVFADSWKSHFAVCFKIEFIENEWKIVPMRKYFETMKEMEIFLNLSHLDDYSFDSNINTSDESYSEIKLEDIL